MRETHYRIAVLSRYLKHLFRYSLSELSKKTIDDRRQYFRDKRGRESVKRLSHGDHAIQTLFGLLELAERVSSVSFRVAERDEAIY